MKFPRLSKTITFKKMASILTSKLLHFIKIVKEPLKKVRSPENEKHPNSPAKSISP